MPALDPAGAVLGDFLKARRRAVTPEQVGLVAGSDRRVPGLRREELALLAGVSVDYYTRLEQGRGRNVSEAVLAAISDALQLNEVERRHLFALAKPTLRHSPAPVTVRSTIRMLLNSLEHVPAMVLTSHLDVVDMNPLAVALFGNLMDLPDGHRNITWALFCRPEFADIYVEWECAARNHVAMLSRSTALNPSPAHITTMIGELTMTNPKFAHWWAQQNVGEKLYGHKHLRHPDVGAFEIAYENLEIPGSSGLTLNCYVPEPGSAAERAINTLEQALHR